LAGEQGLSLAQLLALGELQKVIVEQQTKEFQRLHDYIWTLEQRVHYIAAQAYSSTKASRGRNLIRNGDFRLRPGPGVTVKEPAGKYAFSEISPGFVVCYNGRRVSYRAERRKWTADGQKLPFGKTYLHLEHDGQTKDGTWFMLECIIPSTLLLSGQTICISGLGRLKSAQTWIYVGGRYDLGNGQELNWPDQMVSLSDNFGRWNCTLTCPSIEATALARGHQARILLKLPYDQPFEFDLTNFQVELGTTFTEFEYNGSFSIWERFQMLWHKSTAWSKKTGENSTPADSGLTPEVAAQSEIRV
jgi:hypothetical protein